MLKKGNPWALLPILIFLVMFIGIGIAGGDGVGLIFRRGEIIKKVPQEQLVDALMDEIAQYEGE